MPKSSVTGPSNVAEGLTPSSSGSVQFVLGEIRGLQGCDIV